MQDLVKTRILPRLMQVSDKFLVSDHARYGYSDLTRIFP